MLRFILIAALCFIAQASYSKEAVELKNVIGSTHAGGLYCLSEKDYLNEGADQLLELGMGVIKVWFTGDPQAVYPFNSAWPKINNLVDLARTPYFVSLFQKPFSVFILETYAPGKADHYYLKGMTEEDKAWESKQFYDIARYLLNRYKGSGKTFILQNWESDWALTHPSTMLEPDDTAIKGMIDWFNARQDGVEKARKEFGMNGVTVAHAAEVNLIARGMEGKKCAVNNVIPNTHCDLYSYSAWDTQGDDKLYRKALSYLKEKAPASKLFGDNNVFIGEYGAPENKAGGNDKQCEAVKRITETSLEMGMKYIVYWELYCNEPMKKYEGAPANSDLSGFWLIRPDNTKPDVWRYFKNLLKSN